jgi:hypothetical protein
LASELHEQGISKQFFMFPFVAIKCQL